MLTPNQALERIREGLAQWTEVDMRAARFVGDDDVSYRPTEIIVHSADFLDMSSEGASAVP
jgi:hypothetical protein